MKDGGQYIFQKMINTWRERESTIGTNKEGLTDRRGERNLICFQQTNTTCVRPSRTIFNTL